MNINFTDLENKIEDVIGVKVRLEGEVVNKDNSYARINFQSNDIGKKLGIHNLFATMHVSNFGGGYNPEEDKYYVPVHIQWTYRTGGSNGHEVFDSIYDVCKERWTFKNLP